MRRRLGVVGLVLSLGLAGCGFIPGAAPSLEQNGWRATLVAGSQPVAGREPTLRFAGGQVTGSGGCNRIFGGFTIEGDRLEVRDLSIEWLRCPVPVGEIEAGRIGLIEGLLIEVLSKAETARFDGQNLVISGGGGEIHLRPDPGVR